jgi:RNA polymerase sigma-70 factor (ECF subfamily)
MTVERTDEELMAAYVAGDRTALDDLFHRYAPRLLSILGRGIPRADAADLLQQTFLQLHRSRHDFRQGAPLRPWLFTIAINVKRQHLRSLSRRREATLGDDVERLADFAVAADSEGPRVDLVALLAELPRGQRRVLELRLVEGLSFAHIAERLGASVAAVRVRAHRAYLRLRVRAAEKEGTR